MDQLPPRLEAGRQHAYNIALQLSRSEIHNVLADYLSLATQTEEFSTTRQQHLLLGQCAYDAAIITLWLDTNTHGTFEGVVKDTSTSVMHFTEAASCQDNKANIERLYKTWAQVLSLQGIARILQGLHGEAGLFLPYITQAQNVWQQIKEADSNEGTNLVTAAFRAQLQAIDLGRTNQMQNGYSRRLSETFLNNAKTRLLPAMQIDTAVH